MKLSKQVHQLEQHYELCTSGIAETLRLMSNGKTEDALDNIVQLNDALYYLDLGEPAPVVEVKEPEAVQPLIPDDLPKVGDTWIYVKQDSFLAGIDPAVIAKVSEDTVWLDGTEESDEVSLFKFLQSWKPAKEETCWMCKGTGSSVQNPIVRKLHPCPKCFGTGLTTGYLFNQAEKAFSDRLAENLERLDSGGALMDALVLDSSEREER